MSIEIKEYVGFVPKNPENKTKKTASKKKAKERK